MSSVDQSAKSIKWERLPADKEWGYTPRLWNGAFRFWDDETYGFAHCLVERTAQGNKTMARLAVSIGVEKGYPSAIEWRGTATLAEMAVVFKDTPFGGPVDVKEAIQSVYDEDSKSLSDGVKELSRNTGWTIAQVLKTIKRYESDPSLDDETNLQNYVRIGPKWKQDHITLIQEGKTHKYIRDFDKPTSTEFRAVHKEHTLPMLHILAQTGVLPLFILTEAETCLQRKFPDQFLAFGGVAAVKST
jgi:hypothetical protein